VAVGGRQAHDPALAGEATAALVNRVIATALGYVDLSDATREAVPDATITNALWNHATTRRDILVLAQGHLAALEQQGSDRARAQALNHITRALHNPPLLPP